MANATTGAGPGLLLATMVLSMARAALNSRQQNNGRTGLGAFAWTQRLKMTSTYTGNVIQHKEDRREPKAL